MNDERFHVIYLTGPPASGKSTLVTLLEKKVSPMQSFIYSKVLAEHLSNKFLDKYSQEDMREKSAQLITPEDIEIVDNQLLDFVAENRRKSHVIIDSHAVTKETYGFRVTPFSLDKIKRLGPSLIFMLYTSPLVAVNRIIENSQGRPAVSEFEAGFHCELQASVALIYGINLGIPIYFLDSDKPPSELVFEIADRIR